MNVNDLSMELIDFHCIDRKIKHTDIFQSGSSAVVSTRLHTAVKDSSCVFED